MGLVSYPGHPLGVPTFLHRGSCCILRPQSNGQRNRSLKTYYSYSYWWKQNIQSTSWFFGSSLRMVILCLSFTSYIVTDSALKGSTLWFKRVSVSNTLGLSTALRNATQARKHNLGSEKIPATTTPLTSGSLTPQIIVRLIIRRGAWWELEIHKTPNNIKNELKIVNFLAEYYWFKFLYVFFS